MPETPSRRRCTGCGACKPISEFAPRAGRKQRDYLCRQCRATYLHQHYKRHKDRYVASAVRRKRALVAGRNAYLVDFFRERNCVDCGESDPLVLEFDHLGNKKFSITRGINERRWQSVLDEIAKCEVVCANCHRRRTAQRGDWLRAALARQYARGSLNEADDQSRTGS